MVAIKCSIRGSRKDEFDVMRSIWWDRILYDPHMEDAN
jgi:hypothetical protein